MRLKVCSIPASVLLLIALMTMHASAALAQAQISAGSVDFSRGSSTGGTVDTLGRTVANGLQKQIGRTAYVENRTGAGGNTGVAELAHSTPDGSTIGMITVATHGINPTLYGSKLPFDPINDFAPITMVAELSTVLVINSSLPAKNLKEFVAYVKANSGKVLFGSAGIGTSLHLSGELFNIATGAKMVHVPYRGAASALPDLLSGRIQAMFLGVREATPQVEAGKLRPLAIPSTERTSLLPNVPTFGELGYKDVLATTWFGVAAPKGTPADIIQLYNGAIRKIMADPALESRFAESGIVIRTDLPEQFAAFIKSEIARWKQIVEASGAEVN